MIERVLYSFLRDSEAIRDKVGNRIFAGNAPAGTKGAAIILKVLSRVRDDKYTLQNEIGVTESIVQIDCYDERPALAYDLFEAVRNRLSGYYGTISHKAASGDETTTDIQSAVILREGAIADAPQDGSDRWTSRHSADFRIIHSQPVPTHE